MQMKSRIEASRKAGEALINATRDVLNTMEGGDAGFGLVPVCEALAQYAWEGTWHSDSLEVSDYLHDIGTAAELLRGRFMLPAGTDCLPDDDRNAIELVATAAQARWSLSEDMDIRIEDLAALAGVAERTIRAATNPNSPNAIPITKQGHWTWIQAKDALEWLSRRKDFMPTRLVGLGPRASRLHSSESLGQTCKQWRAQKNVQIAELAKQLNWTPRQSAGYVELEEGQVTEDALLLTPSSWQAYAQRLDIEEPARFAAKAFRLTTTTYAEARITTELGADH